MENEEGLKGDVSDAYVRLEERANELVDELEHKNLYIQHLESLLSDDTTEFKSAAFQKIKTLERALRIELNEPMERVQEATHYNWLDNQNDELKAKAEQAEKELQRMKDICTEPVHGHGMWMYVKNEEWENWRKRELEIIDLTAQLEEAKKDYAERLLKQGQEIIAFGKEVVKIQDQNARMKELLKRCVGEVGGDMYSNTLMDIEEQLSNQGDGCK